MMSSAWCRYMAGSLCMVKEQQSMSSMQATAVMACQCTDMVS